MNLILIIGSRGILGIVVLSLFIGMGAKSVSAPSHSTPCSVLVSTPLSPPAPHRDAPRSRGQGSQAIPFIHDELPANVHKGGRLASAQGWRKNHELLSAQLGLRPSKHPDLTELTKPAYLMVRLLATPTNHRAPPA